ncbi:hypothetical protein ACHHRT_12685 [Desulfurivibrio sp. D14AmB]|uniref:hypothetical protein n=1 Tax=Desulfurivibrio sp. D14AmB TaxID=3374370 RepID=UPI00376F1279
MKTKTVTKTIQEVFGLPGKIKLEVRQDSHPMVPVVEEHYVFRRETMQDVLMWLLGAAGIEKSKTTKVQGGRPLCATDSRGDIEGCRRSAGRLVLAVLPPALCRECITTLPQGGSVYF